MADLTDVETAIVNIVAAAIYPNGSSQPSSLPNAAAAEIGRGWPTPQCLDAYMAAGNVQITIYPSPGSAGSTYQILDETYVIVPPVTGMVFSLNGNVITVSGQPTAGEYLTLECDHGHVFSRSGANTAAILSALATDAQAFYPTASSTATTLTVPVQAYLVVRQGAPGIEGKVTHRQRQSICISVWAPNDALRTAAAIAADVALKENIKITLPDTSQCALRYLNTRSSDQMEAAMIYRRELIYEAEYATLQQFTGYPITSVQTSIINPNGTTATAMAVT